MSKCYRFLYCMLMVCLFHANFLFAKQKSNVSGTSLLTMVVGTYTEGSISKGMYVYRFNQNTGESNLLSSVTVGNPSYVVVAGGDKYAYSVSEYNDGTAKANAFRFNKEKGKMVFLNSYLTAYHSKGGEDPCYILATGKQVVTANYTGGDISVFPVNEKGELLPQSQHFFFKEGVAHIHCLKLTPDKKYLLVNDLGNDCIYRFDVNNAADYKNKQPYLKNCTVVYKGTKGMGPRHLVFNKEGKNAYLINELGGIVVVFGYNNGILKPIQAIMADEGGGHGSADIHISPDGRFLYTSHRLKKDGIAIFRINKTDGRLTKIGYQQTGIHPRNFNITPNGKYLLVACRDSNEIEVFKVNKKSGMLVNTTQHIVLGKPVCVQFVK